MTSRRIAWKLLMASNAFFGGHKTFAQARLLFAMVKVA